MQISIFFFKPQSIFAQINDICAKIIAKNTEYVEKYGRIVRRLMLDTLEISSTEIRRRVAAGEPISHLVPPVVEAYVKKHGLYRAEVGE